jgi:hypothetical protein
MTFKPRELAEMAAEDPAGPNPTTRMSQERISMGFLEAKEIT